MDEPMYLAVHKTEDILQLFDNYLAANSNDVDAQLHASNLRSLFVKECPTYVARCLISVEN